MNKNDMQRKLIVWLGVLAISAVALVGGVTSAPGSWAAPGDAFDPADSAVFIAQNQPTQLYRAVPDAAGAVTFVPEGGPSQIT